MAQRTGDHATRETRRRRAMLVSGLSMSLGCGGFEPPPPPEAPHVVASPLMVRADPPGHEFSGATIVRLRPMEGADIDIFYTVDGTPPTADDAVRYEGALELDATTLLNYIARDANGAWSAPGSELYVSKVPTPEAREVRRGLEYDPDLVFFAWKQGDPIPMREKVTLTALGQEPLTISSIRLVRNPSGQFFWESGAFELTVGDERRTLAPGESLELELSYVPTSTFRSAAIEVRSNDERNDGVMLIEVWGRTSAW